MKVYFLIFSTNSLYGKLIKFWTRTPYTHVSFSLTLTSHISNDSGRWALTEIPKDKKFEVWELEVPPNEGNYMFTFYQQLTTKYPKYDWLGALGFFFKWKKENPNKYFCSEAFGKLFQKLYFWDTFPPYKYTPALVRYTLEIIGADLVKPLSVPFETFKEEYNGNN